jgi:ABC-2 type transport system ATP-binding protein
MAQKIEEEVRLLHEASYVQSGFFFSRVSLKYRSRVLSGKAGESVMTSSNAVELNNVTKRYNEIVAVDHVNLTIGSGEIFGLLGPNGSGKSTTLKMLLGLVHPDEGTVTVLGTSVQQDPVAVKRMVGYVPEAPKLYEFLTGVEYLDFIGDVYSMNPEDKKNRINEYLKAMQLDGREGDMITSYSEGMKQKIALIAAFLHKPKLLIMDEPINALDPRSARIVKDFLQELKKQNVSAILSTHILEIAQAMCDRIGIMFQGKLLALGNMNELRQMAKLPNSELEDIFLKLTGSGDVRPIVEELLK